MKSIGIIANPNSGKDIRRLFSYSLTIGNNEKANLVERMVLGAQELGVGKIYFMPDEYNMGNTIKSTLSMNGDLKCEIEILDYKPRSSSDDTFHAAKMFDDIGVGCIITLGGDGTSRLVAATKTQIPLIPVSTGTNNVYPRFYEGTIVGMTAAVVCNYGSITEFIHKDKIIEVYKNGSIVDYALIDVAITSNEHVGSRAIEKLDDIDEIIVSRCHPASIGFSSVIGVDSISTESDPFGYRILLHHDDSDSYDQMVPVTAGKMTRLKVSKPVKMDLDNMYVYKPVNKGTIALDGEKTVTFNNRDILAFAIRKKGPHRVNVEKALEYAVKNKFFRI